MWCVTWEISNLKKSRSGSSQRTQLQGKWKHSNWIPKKANSINVTQTSSKRTHSFTGRNDSPNELGKHSAKCYTKRVLQPSRTPPPPLILLHTIFDRKGSPFVYLLLTNDTPSNCRKCTIFWQIVNKSLNQEVFVTLLQQQNASVIYPFWFSVLFNRFFLEKSLPIRTWSLNKKLFFSSGSHGTSPYRPLQVEHSSPLFIWRSEFATVMYNTNLLRC